MDCACGSERVARRFECSDGSEQIRFACDTCGARGNAVSRGKFRQPDALPLVPFAEPAETLSLFDVSPPAGYTLRPYQARCVDGLWHFFASGKRGNPLIVAPTGAGKSLIISGFCKRALSEYPGTRILVVTHVRELVEQNAGKLDADLGAGRVGVYSAGLGRRELDAPVIVAGVQSIAHRVDELPDVDLVIIDEAHLVPSAGEGRYRSLIAALEERNPHLRVIGLSATPYRLGTGMLHRGDGRIFTHIAVEVGIPELIDKGYLSPVRTKLAKTQPNLDGVHVRAGEYVGKEMAEAMGDGELIERTLDEVEMYAADRKSILFFCASVEHAEATRAALDARGYSVELVTGKTPNDERDATVARFREKSIRALVNVAVFTTGFDAPGVDCVVLMRATMSPGLYCQMVGRGLRVEDGKTDCLVLDFGRNVERHGPLDAVRVAADRPKGTGAGEGEAPFRLCPACCEVSPLASPTCPACGFEFPVFEADPHDAEASDAALLQRDRKPGPVAMRVRDVSLMRHRKEGKPDSLRVRYQVGLRSISEWVCLEHEGYAGRKARVWWRERAFGDVPATITEALERERDIRTPAAIGVIKDGDYDRIVAVQYEEEECA